MRGFDRAALAQVLLDGIEEMKLDVPADQQIKLMDYVQLMAKWNSVYNLTSLRDPMQIELDELDRRQPVSIHELLELRDRRRVDVDARDPGRGRVRRGAGRSRRPRNHERECHQGGQNQGTSNHRHLVTPCLLGQPILASNRGSFVPGLFGCQAHRFRRFSVRARAAGEQS